MKTKRLLSVLMLACLLPLSTLAEVWQDPVSKVNYTYYPGRNEASVSGSYYYGSAGSPNAQGNIKILSKIRVDGNDYIVTSIGQNAFFGCALTNVTIPNTVISIGSYSFLNCHYMTKVDIPNSVKSIGDNAFELCSRLSSINLPDGVTDIGSHAFNGCSGITSITIPNSVTTIGYGAFSGCGIYNVIVNVTNNHL